MLSISRRSAAVVCAAVGLIIGGAAPLDGGRQRDQRALGPFADLVGSWKGTGQPQRSSTRGAWREAAEWAWSLAPESASLAVRIEDGKFLRSGALRPGDGPDEFRFETVLADGTRVNYVGRINARKALVLEAAGPPRGPIGRITLTPLHASRFLLLLESPPTEGGAPVRLAEIGYTRQGATFAVGSSYPECIVTGGKGTIKVSYQGKDYWVCCSGCKDLFEAGPAEIIAEAAAGSK